MGKKDKEFEVVGGDEFLEEEETLRKKSFLSLNAGTVTVFLIGLVFAVLGLLRFAESHQIKSQIEKVNAKCEQYKDVEKKVNELKKRAVLVKSMFQKIQELQGERARTIEFFFALNKLVPAGVKITSIEKTGLRVHISGFSVTSDVYSVFISSLNSSGFFSQKIEESRNKEGKFLMFGNFLIGGKK